MRMERWVALFGLCALLVVLAGSCRPSRAFDGDLAYRYVEEQCTLGSRSIGSEGHAQIVNYLIRQLEKFQTRVSAEEFDYRGQRLVNIVAKTAEGKGPVVLLGTHYDTRRFADNDPIASLSPVLGANDGASGTAVLLELARVVDRRKLRNELWFAFFDGEDQGGIEGWPWSVGARHLAEQLDELPACAVIVDMVGDAQQQIYWERNSSAALLTAIWDVAASLGYRTYFLPEYKYAVIDDHIPFRERGIPVALLIDLDYPYWHTTQDTLDKISPASLERVGRVLEKALEGGLLPCGSRG